ncbi:hypothetical protein HGP29_11290 [Flammeovirga sp. SR4]|uniref:Uncharacterized protein n=1 Tax=Flammeovirga agarivorans TaxID=2726742 RepID=A0A7X8SKA2_9BACT|nr:hypothetical protein [Flammeovirga agarivorans]
MLLPIVIISISKTIMVDQIYKKTLKGIGRYLSISFFTIVLMLMVSYSIKYFHSDTNDLSFVGYTMDLIDSIQHIEII